MGIFSEYSLLLIKDWQATHDVLEAEKRLCAELTDFLYSIENDLIRKDWWQNGWIFGKNSQSEIYITKRDWRVTDGDTVLIGVENFCPENIFGLEPPPTLYVYVESRGQYHGLVNKLKDIITDEGGEKLGEVQGKATSRYAIKHGLIQCIPEDIDNYEESARNQIMYFLIHYANLLEKYDKNIKESLIAE